MEKITNTIELNAAILLLEDKQAEQGILLKEEFKITYESLKPVNFIKNTFDELVKEPYFKDDLLNTSISIAVGYFSKKLAIGSTNNPFKQILGSFLQMAITSIVSKNSSDIRTKFMEMLRLVLKRKAK